MSGQTRRPKPKGRSNDLSNKNNNTSYQLRRRRIIPRLNNHPALAKIEYLAKSGLAQDDANKVTQELVKILNKYNLNTLFIRLRNDAEVLLQGDDDNMCWTFGCPSPNMNRVVDIATEVLNNNIMDSDQPLDCDIFARLNIPGKEKDWHFLSIDNARGDVVRWKTAGVFNKSFVRSSDILDYRSTLDYSFEDRVYHMEVYRLHSALVDGRIFDLPRPFLPEDGEYICNPSTFRLYVIPSEVSPDVVRKFRVQKEMAILAGQLQHILSNDATKRDAPGHKGASVRCRVHYACVACNNDFSSNNVWLEKQGDDYVDPITRDKPMAGCRKCFRDCVPCPYKEGGPAIAEFDRLQHEAFVEHSPETCTFCMELGTWCDQSLAKFKRKPKCYDGRFLPLVSEGGLTGDMLWQKHADGLEIKNVMYESYSFRLLITPNIFVIPLKIRELVREKSKDAAWLIRNRAPTELKSFRDVLLALNFSMRASVRENRGAWMNKVVDLFIADGGKYVDAELVDGFKRFQLPVSDDPIPDDWLTAYHGTSQLSAASIFCGGGLKTPLEGSHDVAHGQCGSSRGDSIYTSPSKELAAFPTYSNIFELASSEAKVEDEILKKKKKEHAFGQIVFEVKVKPNSYKIQSSTLSNRRHWPSDLRIDFRFESHAALEWIHDRSTDIVITGILVRQFGHGAKEFDPQKSVPLNSKVEKDWKDPETSSRGPEFHWSYLRKEYYRKMKHTVVQDPDNALCCAYVRKNNDDRVCASIMWRFQPENPPQDAEESAVQLKMLDCARYNQACEQYPITSVIAREPVGRVESYTAEIVDVYVCVESYLVPAIQKDGFTSRVRNNIAVESSIEAATQGYLNHHHEPSAVFRLLPSKQLQTFRNTKGSMRLNTNYIPPDHLELVFIN